MDEAEWERNILTARVDPVVIEETEREMRRPLAFIHIADED